VRGPQIPFLTVRVGRRGHAIISTMQIDVAFTDEDRLRLRRALGPGRDVDALATLLASAGAAEMIALATGRTVPATMAEARAFRIYSMLQQGMSLAEVEDSVAAVFKVTSTSARRMVDAAVARYSVELDEGLSSAIADALDAAEWDPEKQRWNLRLGSAFIRQRILGVAARLPFPDPTPAQAGPVWRFPDETYQAVRGEYQLAARPPPTS
jgi:hypothetical protein